MKAWNRFFHASVSPAALGLFRVLFAYCLWREVRTTRARALDAIDDGLFSLPYTDLIPQLPESLYHLVHDLQYPLILLLGLGLLPRLCSGSLLFLQGWVFFADQLHFRNHPWFFLLVLLLLTFSPAGEAFSLGAWWRGLREGRPWRERLFGAPRPRTAQRLIQLQVCLVYFVAGLHKLHPAYLSGEVLFDKVASELVRDRSGEFFAAVAPELPAALAGAFWPWVFMAAATVALELLLPIGLWFRGARRVMTVFGLGFHASIAFIMDIDVFSYAMMASYLLFSEPETVPRAFERLLAGARRLLSGRTRPGTP